MTGFKEVLTEIKNSAKPLSASNHKDYSIKECWEWFKQFIEDYLAMKKEHLIDEKLMEKIMR